MISKALRKQNWLSILIIAVLLCSVPHAIRAQPNPFNMNSQFSAHMSYDWARDFYRRANSRFSQYNQAKAAADGKDLLFRNELAVGVILTKASFKFALRNMHSGDITSDTSMAFIRKPSETGFHLNFGSGYPLATLSEDAALILSYGLSYDQLKWAIPLFILEGREKDFSFVSNTLGTPLYVDYKWGSEAMLDISKRICFTTGAGILPAYTLTVGDNKNNETYFSLRPTARVEFGLTTKFISFKLQAMGLLGNMNYVDQTDLSRDIDYYAGLKENYDIRIKGKSQFIFSLVLMSMTTSWQNDPWFR